MPSPAAPDVIAEAVARIVRAADPLRIAVFGSVARGTATPGSDLDLLVIVPHVDDRRRETVTLRRAMDDLPVAKDLVLTTPDDVARRGWIVGTVLHEALLHGRTVYERPGRAS